MKSIPSFASFCSLVALARAQVPGFDISGWQETTDFAKAYADGDRFVIIKVSILLQEKMNRNVTIPGNRGYILQE